MLSYEKQYKRTGLAHELEFNFNTIDNEGKYFSESELFKNSEEAVETAKKVNEEFISKLEAIFIVEEVTGINNPEIKEYGFNSVLIVTSEELERIISYESLRELINSTVEVIDLSK